MRINSDEYKPKKLEEEDLKKFVVLGAHENHRVTSGGFWNSTF